MSSNRRQDKLDQQGLTQIEERAKRHQRSYLDSFATNAVNPFNQDTYLYRNIKMFAYVATEATHNTLFHFIETVKVRG